MPAIVRVGILCWKTATLREKMARDRPPDSGFDKPSRNMPLPLDQVVKQIEDSGLVAVGTLRDFLPPKKTPKDAEELIADLVRRNKLTKFQAEEICRGKGKSLTLGNYVLLEKIGAGGMGVVFKAHHRLM